MGEPGAKRQLHLLHVGKTGGTAVKYALGQQLETPRYMVRLHTHNVALRDIPDGEGVIAFVRDPVTRFVSSFYSRRREGRPRIVAPWTPSEREAFERFATPNQLALALSSAEPEQRRSAERAMRSIYHVKSSYWDWFHDDGYVRARASDIFFVGRQERLREDFERLRHALDLPPTIDLPSDDVQAHVNPRECDYSLSDAAVGTIRDWYKADYRFMDLCQELFGLRPVGQDPALARTRAGIGAPVRLSAW